MPKSVLARPAVVIFIVAVLVVAVGGVILASQQVGVTFKVLNPSLTLSVTSLPFGNIVGTGVTTIATFTITNTGNVPLLLAYRNVGFPSWAIVHLAITGPYNQGGIDLIGVSLASDASVTVYPSLEIVPGGLAGDYSGQVWVDGS